MFTPLSFISVLQSSASGTAVSIIRTLLNHSSGFVDGIVNIGIGIGSIFLLVVVFVYISQILDGGKFQVKMLLPLLIYVAVCNFKMVAGPVVFFATKLQETCVSVCNTNRIAFLDNMSGGKYSQGKCAGLFGVWLEAFNPLKDKVEEELEEDATDYVEINSSMSSSAANEENSVSVESTQKIKGLGSNIANAFKKLWQELKKAVVASFTGSFTPAKLLTYGLTGLIVMLVDWISQALLILIVAMGSVLFALVVTFGPITWAFAIFPGNSRVIGAWCIRLCQFALYSPLVAIIEAFFIIIMKTFTESLASLNTLNVSSNGPSLIACFGVILALCAAIMQVPAIASMIIEGAQGTATLSQGINTAISATHDVVEMVNGHSLGSAGMQQGMQQATGPAASSAQSTSSPSAPSGLGGGTR